MIAIMTVEAATDAEIFLAYLDHVVCPALRPGDMVVMDNLSSHKVAGVRDRIAAAGAELLYLLLRAIRARAAETLSQNFCQPSELKTRKPGSEHRFILYSNEEYALGVPRGGYFSLSENAQRDQGRRGATDRSHSTSLARSLIRVPITPA